MRVHATWLSVLLFILAIMVAEAEPQADASWSDTLYTPFEWLYGPAQKCRYRQNLAMSVNETLRKHITGQNDGIDAIVNAISVWELRKAQNSGEPLVLAITGPTGVGKTETAFRLSETLFAGKKAVSEEYGRGEEPCGLLALRGEDYSPSSEAAKGGVHELHSLLKARIVDHLVQTEGNALILFDEVQKVMPGTLEMLMPALEARGSLSSTSYEAPHRPSLPVMKMVDWMKSSLGASKIDLIDCDLDEEHPSCKSDKPMKASAFVRPVTRRYPTDRAIFLFISDIGVEKMTKQLIIHGDRSAIPPETLRSEVKAALDEQWQRLKFGKVISEVVPFLPMEPAQVTDVLKLNLNRLSTNFRSQRWLRLAVDDEVVSYLTSQQFVDYKNHTVTMRVARKASADQLVPFQGEVGVEADQQITRSKIFATYGARAVRSGPLQKLEGLISRHAQRSRPEEILHIGILSSQNIDRSSEWGNRDHSQMQIYLQWCKPDESMLLGSTRRSSDCEGEEGVCKTDEFTAGSKSAVARQKHLQRQQKLHEQVVSAPVLIDDDLAFSDLCDTIWFGPLPK